jgi:hypothetical protein
MAMGLIAAALGGAGKALASVGEMEAKKQNEAKLRKELMAAESDERLRLDEVIYKRKMARLPEEAIAQARATAGAEAVGYEERNRLNVPELAADYAARGKAAGYKAESKVDIPKLEAERKVKTRLAELSAVTDNKLDEAEARAKYNAFMTDLRIAKELGVDVAEMERAAEKENARISALIKSRVPAKEAQLANERRLETVRAQLDSNIITEEANLLAKQELAKVQAMIAEGVPEAEAKLLAAKWRAGKTQRDEAAAEKTQQEITAEIETAKSLAKDPTYLKNKRAIEAATRFTTGGSSKSENKTKTSLDLERELKASTQKLALALGVDDNKVGEAYKSLSKKALTDPKAKEKLDEIQPLFDAVNTRLTALENFTVDSKSENKSNKSSSPSSATYNYVQGKGLQPTK